MSKHRMPGVETQVGSSSEDEDEKSSQEIEETEETKSSEHNEEQEDSSTEEEEEEEENTGLPLLPKKPPPKRQQNSENNMCELKEAKRAKLGVVHEEENNVEGEKKGKKLEESRRVLFQRVWSEDDEIVILNGLIEYKKMKGVDVVDLNALLDLVKKSLQVNVSKSQLSDKIRRLKRKFKNNVRKAKKGELRRIFRNAHEQRSYELSKKIWGIDNMEGEKNGLDASKKKGKEVVGMSGKDVVVAPQLYDWAGFGGHSSFGKKIARDGMAMLDLISGPKKAELEEKHKELVVEEIKLFLKQLELESERTKLALEVMKLSS